MKTLLLLLAALLLAGCNLPLTRSTILVPDNAEHPVASVAWLRLPEDSGASTRSNLEGGMARSLAMLPTNRAAGYRRYWEANLDFMFSVIHMVPPAGPGLPATSRLEPRKQVLVALRLPSGGPAGIGEALNGDGELRMLLGGDDLAAQPAAGAWSLRFGFWPSLTGEPGRLACWDPIRLQIENGNRISKPTFSTGIVIDRATWDALAAGTAVPETTATALHSTRFVASSNPLRWLATPVTLIIDAVTFGDDDGERHRIWAANRLDTAAPAAQK